MILYKVCGMDTKRKIINSAIELFGQHGYDGVTIDMLVKKAGINKSTFYYHYESKISLFHFVLHSRLSHYHETIRAEISSSKTPDEMLTGLIDVVFSREKADLQLFTRELTDGGRNITPDIFRIMYDIAEAFFTVLYNDEPEITTFHIYILMGTSDFFLNIRNLQDNWKKHVPKNHSIVSISFDEENVRNRLKNLLLREIKQTGE